MAGRRASKEDRWMPSRVYRGKSGYEYHPKEGGSVALGPLTSTKDEVLTAHAQATQELSGLTEKVLTSKMVSREERRRRLADARQSKGTVPKTRAELYRQLIRLFSGAKARAKKNGKSFTLTEQDIHQLIDEANWRCQLTGIPFETGRRGYKFGPFRPSVDRIDSSLGYVPGNVRLVCTSVNLALGQWGEEAFKKISIGYVLMQSGQ